MNSYQYYLDKMESIKYSLYVEKAQLMEYRGTEDYELAKEEYQEFYADCVTEYNDLVADGLKALAHADLSLKEFSEIAVRFKKIF